MSRAILKRKWRPALWMVVFGLVMVVALAPLIGLLGLIGAEKAFEFTFELRTVAGFLTLAAGSLLTALLIGAVFLRTLLRPLQELDDRTSEIEAGASQAFRPMDHGGTVEVANLGERFFRLARRLSDRSNYLTLFTTHVSHELKTPLTSILGAAELLRESGDSMEGGQRRRFLNNITEDAGRLAALSTRLRELAHADVAATGGSCDLFEVIEQSCRQAGIKAQFEGEGDFPVKMSEQNAQIVWQQLANNAFQHGAAKLSVSIVDTDDVATLFVGDDGAPISEANRDKVFDPFFTTRREAGGTGMGLGIARAMLRSHGGDIRLCDDRDCKFEIKLPI